MPLPILQGTQTKSINEVYLAKALDEAGIEYDYSHWVGSQGERGSVEVDFLITNGTHATPVMVGAEGYFHSARTASEDFVKVLTIERYGKYYGWDELIYATVAETATQDAAREFVKKHF
jgi:hypothetical protein